MTPLETIAISVLTAAAMIKLYASPSVLSWSQRVSRNRAFSIVLLTCVAAMTPSLNLSVFSTAAITLSCFIVCAGLAYRHLRGSSKGWSNHRVRVVARFISLVIACSVSMLAMAKPGTLILWPLISGLWFSLVIRAENTEIIANFRGMQARLVMLEGLRRSATSPEESRSVDPRDNSPRAS